MKMEDFENSREAAHDYSLRQATQADVELMFRLQHLDGKDIDYSDEEQQAKYKKYEEEFDSDKIEVIEHNSHAVGRLRIVRGDSIYIGGLQILPEFRGQGIGTAIVKNLILEADKTQLPVELEVRHNNSVAIHLYEKLGFEVVDEDNIQKIMRYQPNTKKTV